MYGLFVQTLLPLWYVLSHPDELCKNYTRIMDKSAFKNNLGEKVPYHRKTVIECATEWPRKTAILIEREIDNLMPTLHTEKQVERERRGGTRREAYSRMRKPCREWKRFAEGDMLDFRRSFPFQDMAQCYLDGDMDGVTLIGTLYELVRRCYEEDTKASLGVIARSFTSIGHQPPPMNQDDIPGIDVDMQLGPILKRATLRLVTKVAGLNKVISIYV